MRQIRKTNVYDKYAKNSKWHTEGDLLLLGDPLEMLRRIETGSVDTIMSGLDPDAWATRGLDYPPPTEAWARFLRDSSYDSSDLEPLLALTMEMRRVLRPEGNLWWVSTPKTDHIAVVSTACRQAGFVAGVDLLTIGDARSRPSSRFTLSYIVMSRYPKSPDAYWKQPEDAPSKDFRVDPTNPRYLVGSFRMFTHHASNRENQDRESYQDWVPRAHPHLRYSPTRPGEDLRRWSKSTGLQTLFGISPSLGFHAYLDALDQGGHIRHQGDGRFAPLISREELKALEKIRGFRKPKDAQVDVRKMLRASTPDNGRVLFLGARALSYLEDDPSFLKTAVIFNDRDLDRVLPRFERPPAFCGIPRTLHQNAVFLDLMGPFEWERLQGGQLELEKYTRGADGGIDGINHRDRVALNIKTGKTRDDSIYKTCRAVPADYRVIFLLLGGSCPRQLPPNVTLQWADEKYIKTNSIPGYACTPIPDSERDLRHMIDVPQGIKDRYGKLCADISPDLKEPVQGVDSVYDLFSDSEGML